MLTGIALAFASAISYNAGFVVEKRALQRMPEVHAGRSLHMLRTLGSSPLWMLGFAMSLMGTGLQVLALSRAPLSVVQPIIASGIVVLLLLSRLVLAEHLGRVEWAGIVTVGIALVLVGISLDATSEPIGTAGSVLRIVAAAVPTALLAGAAFLAAGRRQRASAPLFGLAAGLVYGVSGLATKGVSVIVEEDGLMPAVPRVLASPDLYLLLAFAAVGLLFFQTGLQRGRASVLVPVSSVVASAYPVAVGMVLFGERLPSAAWRIAVRCAGLAGVVVGTFVLASGRSLRAAYGSGEPMDIEIEAAASS